MILKILRAIFGISPVLLNIEERAKRMEATVNGEHEWFLVCRQLERDAPEEKIECTDREIYIKQVMKK